MREKVREFPGELEEGAWQTVKRRRRQSPPKSIPSTANKTIFIDFLPMEINTQTLRFIFLPHGSISTIVIPQKLRENCRHRYAFIKYSSTQSLLSAISQENGRKIGTFKLKVNPAKYDSPTQSFHNQPHMKPRFQKHNPFMSNQNAAIRDHRSYKEATYAPHPNYPINHQDINPTNPSQMNPPKKIINPTPVITAQKSQTNQLLEPKQILEPNPEIFEREMSRLRIMHSRVLGENTEKIREQVRLEEMDGEQIISIQGRRSGENDELFKRSAIAVAHSSSSSEIIHGHILAEGVNCLKIKPLGGLLHLIIFDTIEDKEEMVRSQWLLNWFMEIRPVNKSSAAIWRQTHLVIYGVPLSAWNYENFFNIGNIYGRVISVEYARMDCAIVTVITDCFFLINNPVILNVEGELFKIFVSEKGSVEVNPEHNSKGHHKTTEEDDPKEEDESPQTDEMESPIVRPSPMHEEEMEKSAVDLGRDDNNYLFNDSMGTPNKTAQKNLSIHQSPFTPFSQKDTTNELSKTGPSPLSDPPLPSLENLQIFSPPPKTFTPSKLNLERDMNLNLDLSPKKTEKIPAQNQTTQANKYHSPIQKKPTSKSLSSSPSVSGPSIPPGFEDFIPSPLKIQHESRRIKKLQKKREKRLRASTLSHEQKKSDSLISPQKEDVDAIAGEIIELGFKMGMNFQGSLSDLHCKIRSILTRQNQDWNSFQ